jgi:hypothetical protein
LNNRPTANLKLSVAWSLELSADVPTFREINGSDVPPAGEQISKIKIGSQGTFSFAGGAEVCGGSR